MASGACSTIVSKMPRVMLFKTRELRGRAEAGEQARYAGFQSRSRQLPCSLPSTPCAPAWPVATLQQILPWREQPPKNGNPTEELSEGVGSDQAAYHLLLGPGGDSAEGVDELQVLVCRKLWGKPAELSPSSTNA